MLEKPGPHNTQRFDAQCCAMTKLHDSFFKQETNEVACEEVQDKQPAHHFARHGLRP
jgi:hypothetical protein